MTDTPNVWHTGGCAFSHLRRGSSVPCEFRLARRNGELVFQAGYQWYEGNTSGVEWKDMPIIDLDEEVSDD